MAHQRAQICSRVAFLVVFKLVGLRFSVPSKRFEGFDIAEWEKQPPQITFAEPQVLAFEPLK